MSLIFCDGFDDGLFALDGKWTYKSSCSVVGGGRNGSAMQLTGNTNGVARKQFAAADEHATFIIGRAFYTGSSNGLNAFGNAIENICGFRSDSGLTAHVTITVNGGVLTAWRGGSGAGTVLGTSGINQLVINTWYYIETKATLHDTTGSVEVRVNGVTWINLTNVDTKNGGTKSVFDSIGFQGSDGSGSETLMDDLYVCNGAGSTNNTFLGDIAVETLFPDGNGSSSQFTGSDGNSTDNYLLVDEASPSTLDYVQNGTNGQRDLYTYAALTRASGTVYGVQTTAYAQKADSGDRSLKNVAKSSSTTSAATAQTLATTWSAKSSVYETDPNTSTAWTVTTVNAAEFGVETSA